MAWNGHDDDGSGRYGMYFSDGNYTVRKGVTKAYRNSRKCIDKKTFTITRGIGYYKINVLVRDLRIERKGKI